jgi:hypothetical protein
MDPDLYDEFGNYVGPELESESDSESEEEKEREEEEEEEEDMQEGEEREEEEMARSMAIVLHVDKKYYPTAGEVGHPPPPLNIAYLVHKAPEIFSNDKKQCRPGKKFPHACALCSPKNNEAETEGETFWEKI